MCKFDNGNDRRQNRGYNEEVQALTERLVQYQRFVVALRSSSSGDAGNALQWLRGPSTEAAPGDVAFAAALQLLNESKPDPLASMNVEETSALVGWIKRDLDTADRTSSSPPPLSTETSLGGQVPDVVASVQTTVPNKKVDISVRRLLC